MHLTKREAGPWLLAALVIVLMLVPLPLDVLQHRWPALTAELQNFGHPVVFALLSHLVLLRLRGRRHRNPAAPYLWVLAGATLLGLGTEAAQALLGRDASWADLRNDLLGTTTVLLLHARREQQSPRSRQALAVIAVCLAALAVAPLAHTTAAYASRTMQGPGVIWRAGVALMDRFSHWQTGPFPGLVIDEPIADWRRWQFLEIDVETLVATPVRIHVRAHDLSHEGDYSDRYNEVFVLPGQTREVLRIPVQRIGNAPATRVMDLARVRGMIVFARARDARRRFTVHEIRLAP